MLPWMVLVAVVQAEPGLDVDVPGDAPCALAVALPAALSGQRVSLAPSQWRLQVRLKDNALEVVLEDKQGVLRGTRRVQVHDDDCPLIPKAIAALVRAWLDESLDTPEAPAPPESTPRPSPPNRVLEPAREAQVEAPRARRAALATADDASPPPLQLPKWVQQLDDGDLEPQAKREHPVGELPQHSLSVELLGGGAVAPADSTVLHGSLGGEVAFYEPWGLWVEGGLETSRSAQWALGTVSTELSWVGASARYAVYLFGMSGLHLSLGGRVERISIDVTGEEVENRDIFTVAAVAALEWRQVLKPGFFFAVRAFAQLRLRAETFSVREMSDVLTIPPWGFGLSLGIGWTFF